LPKDIFLDHPMGCTIYIKNNDIASVSPRKWHVNFGNKEYISIFSKMAPQGRSLY